MSEIPSDLKYTSTHEWVRLEDDGTVTLGVTDHAQELLGDMVFVDLPELETKVSAGAECAVVESVKAASDVFSPITGEVVAINEALGDSPDVVNTDPYGEGWLLSIRPEDMKQLNTLMAADAYEEHVEAAEEHD